MDLFTVHEVVWGIIGMEMMEMEQMAHRAKP